MDKREKVLTIIRRLKKEWGNLSHLLIYHGRAVCQARRPNHAACVLADICPSRNK